HFSFDHLVPASTFQAVERLATAIMETICIIFLENGG
nr:hypothetical protein [Tanacetum cinerariifolium]